MVVNLLDEGPKFLKSLFNKRTETNLVGSDCSSLLARDSDSASIVLKKSDGHLVYSLTCKTSYDDVYQAQRVYRILVQCIVVKPVVWFSASAASYSQLTECWEAPATQFVIQ